MGRPAANKKWIFFLNKTNWCAIWS